MKHILAALGASFCLACFSTSAYSEIVQATNSVTSRALHEGLMTKGGCHRGPRGHRGPHGHRGPRGHRGPHGHHGKQGKRGIRGPYCQVVNNTKETVINNNTNLPLGELLAPSTNTFSVTGDSLTVNEAGVYKVNLSAVFYQSWEGERVSDEVRWDEADPVGLELLIDGTPFSPPQKFVFPAIEGMGFGFNFELQEPPRFTPFSDFIRYIGSRECFVSIPAGSTVQIRFTHNVSVNLGNGSDGGLDALRLVLEKVGKLP